MQGEQGGTGNRTIRGDVACTADAVSWKPGLSGGWEWILVGLLWGHGGARGAEAGGAGRRASAGVKSGGGWVAPGTVEPLF